MNTTTEIATELRTVEAMADANSTALLDKLNVAVKEANEAQAAATTAQAAATTALAELVSRSKAVGLLLLKAKELHPKVKDFDAFLKRVDGLQRSRAYDLMRLAGGRTTDEELKKNARERKQKSRAISKQKSLPGPAPKDSVTVTETAEASAERMKAQPAAAETAIATETALANFRVACDIYLPKMNAAHRDEAIEYAVKKIGRRYVQTMVA